MIDAAIFAYFVLLVWALVRPRTPVGGTFAFLLRGLAPNWRFYHAPGWVPRLFLRSAAGEGWGAWIMIMPRARRRLGDLVHNPANNLALYEQTLIEHLADDVVNASEGAAIVDLVSYRLAANLAALRGAEFFADGTRRQFCICWTEPGSPPNFEADLILMSPVF